MQASYKKMSYLFYSWKRNVRKKALNAGKTHRAKSGRFVHARETGPACGCKLNCFENVNAEERKRVIDFLNGLADYNKQNLLLKGMYYKILTVTMHDVSNGLVLTNLEKLFFATAKILEIKRNFFF